MAAITPLIGANMFGSALGAIGGSGNSENYSAGQSWGSNSGIGYSTTMGSGKEAMAFEDAQAQRAMEFSANEAQKNRDFQLAMSNTAFQRAVTDMRKAGINPILAAGTQASTGTGAMASAASGRGHTDSYSQNIQNGIQGSISSAYGYSQFANGLTELYSGLNNLMQSKTGAEITDVALSALGFGSTNGANAASNAASKKGEPQKDGKQKANQIMGAVLGALGGTQTSNAKAMTGKGKNQEYKIK